MIKDIFKSKPGFISEDNIKWWFNQSTTDYARRNDINGISLENIEVWYILFQDGKKTMVILDNKKPIYESTSLESIASHIDLLKLLKLRD